MVEQIAKALVDTPESVVVDQYEDDGETVLELEVAESDLGRVIGRQGRVARAMRALVSAAGIRSHKCYALEIVE